MDYNREFRESFGTGEFRRVSGQLSGNLLSGNLRYLSPPGEDDSLASIRPVFGWWPNFRDLLLQDHDEAFTAFTSLRRALHKKS
jgi:hypothetical protein